MYIVKVVQVLLLSFAVHGSPIKREGLQTPAQDRKWGLFRGQLPQFEINPNFGFRSYHQIRYEPMNVPFEHPMYAPMYPGDMPYGQLGAYSGMSGVPASMGGGLDGLSGSGPDALSGLPGLTGESGDSGDSGYGPDGGYEDNRYGESSQNAFRSIPLSENLNNNISPAVVSDPPPPLPPTNKISCKKPSFRSQSIP